LSCLFERMSCVEMLLRKGTDVNMVRDNGNNK